MPAPAVRSRLPRRLALGLCIAMALGGCRTLGPDYREPEVGWLASWQPDLHGLLTSPQRQNELDLHFWWRTFNDPVLNELVETARRNNPSLQIAGLRILESRAVLGIAGSAQYPQIQQVTGSAAYVDTHRSGGPGGDRSDSYTTGQAGFEIGWEIDFWGRFQRAIESAQAGFFASMTNHHDLQVLLSAQVAELYYQYRTTLLRIAIARENAGVQQRSLEITERLYNEGEESELDMQQAKAQRLATLATIPELEAALVRIRNALCITLGRPPGELPELSGASGALPVVSAAAMTQMPANLLLRRPDVRTAAWQVAAQSPQIGIAEADLYPSIALLGSFRWTTDSLDSSPDVRTALGGPVLSWNILDYGRIRNNVRVQDARLQQAIEGFEARVLQAAREIDDAAVQVVKTREQEVILRDALQAAERSLTLASTRYQEGYADFQRVLDAQRVVFVQAERELASQSAHVSALIDLYRALGGGWIDLPIEELVPEDMRETMDERTNWGDLLTSPLPPEGQRQPGAGTAR